MKRYIILFLYLCISLFYINAQTLQSPLYIGSQPYPFTYTDTQNTANFSNSYGRATNEVFYKFTLATAMEVTMTHCNSAVSDTYMYLLDASKTLIVSNDDYSGEGQCSTHYHSYIKRQLAAGTYYVVSEGYSANGNITTNITGNIPAVEAPVTDIGSKSVSFTYSNIQNTANSANYYTTRSANDVWYKFTITQNMAVILSHNGSAVSNTCVYLLNASKSPVNSNTGNPAANLSIAQLAAGTYYVVSEGYSANGNITTTIQGTISTPVPVQVQASLNQNYIKTRTYISETGSSYLDVVQYYDGLGRPNQQVQVGVTPSRQDLITVQEYDTFGRESKTWLPVPKTNNRGAYYNTGSLTTDSRAAYGNDNYAYSEPQYEPSPLNRIEKQYGPGQTWRTANRPVSTEYRTNTANDCAKYSVSGNNLVRSAYYDANTLYVTQITDEDNKISYEYSDKLGRVVLQRQMDGSMQHNTYYVYDDFGNLRFVLPPLAADATSSGTFTETSTVIKDYAYQYRYDNRNRCTWKRLPGCEPVTYMYDAADRVIFTQDGELRNQSNRWRFSIPDAFGRVVLEGICTSPSISGVVKASYSTSGTFAAYGYTVSGTDLTLVQMLQANYYDNYQFKSLSQHINNNSQYNYATPAGFENKRYGTDNSTDYSAKGLLTGSITAMLDNSASLHSVYYYDSKGRLIESISQNHLGGFEKEYTNYSFTGQATRHEKIHSAAGKPDIKETYRYYYDHADRLTHTEYNIGDETDVTFTALQYDNLGRLVQKQLHGGKETINYAYNIRNWVNSISSNQFGENLYYETSVAGSTAYYNGNISAMILPPVSGVTSLSRGYTYEYDGLNRLKKARYVENNSAKESFTEEYGYDKQGNMLNLKRNALLTPTASTYTLVDNLTMEYSGNQLKKATDAVTASSTSAIGFVKPSGSTTNEYIFNKNGAMSQDFNRGIAGITYNSLNLPQRIQFMYGHNTQNSYDASGAKRKVTHQTVTGNLNVPLGTTSYTPNSSQIQNTLVTDYSGNIVYENGNLKYILNEEGYVTKSGNNYIFNYYLKDHLGNNRVVIDVSSGSNPTRMQATDYYAFGLPYAFGTSPERQPYKFGGKELDEMHGLNWYDFEARQKDAILPMFTTADPLAEKYYAVSPYAYALNNPVRYVDPDGRNPISALRGIYKSYKAYRAYRAVSVARTATTTAEAITTATAVTATTAYTYNHFLSPEQSEKAMNSLLNEIKNVTDNATSPEYNNQRKREQDAKNKHEQNQANIAKSIDTNISGDMPDGNPSPKRDPNDGGKKTKVGTVIVGVGLGAAAVESVIEGAKPQNEKPKKEEPKQTEPKQQEQQKQNNIWWRPIFLPF